MSSGWLLLTFGLPVGLTRWPWEPWFSGIDASIGIGYSWDQHAGVRIENASKKGSARAGQERRRDNYGSFQRRHRWPPVLEGRGQQSVQEAGMCHTNMLSKYVSTIVHRVIDWKAQWHIYAVLIEPCNHHGALSVNPEYFASGLFSYISYAAASVQK